MLAPPDRPSPLHKEAPSDVFVLVCVESQAVRDFAGDTGALDDPRNGQFRPRGAPPQITPGVGGFVESY